MTRSFRSQMTRELYAPHSQCQCPPWARPYISLRGHVLWCPCDSQKASK